MRARIVSGPNSPKSSDSTGAELMRRASCGSVLLFISYLLFVFVLVLVLVLVLVQEKQIPPPAPPQTRLSRL